MAKIFCAETIAFLTAGLYALYPPRAANGRPANEFSPISEQSMDSERRHNAAGEPKSANFQRLKRRLIRETAAAIIDYNMINDGDRIMVCMSGGKDSYTMLTMLRHLQSRAPITFELIAMNLDQKQPGFPEDVLPTYFARQGVNFEIVEADTYSIVTEKVPEGRTYCSMCSRLRRGIIYTTAERLGATKIALGHHRDDIIETLFLNLFFGAKLKAMPPKLLTDDGKHTVIRPLANCAEEDIARFARAMDYPIIPCTLCGSQPNMQRQNIKAMLAEWEQNFPGRKASIYNAMKDIRPSQLADTSLFDFISLDTAKSPRTAPFSLGTLDQNGLTEGGINDEQFSLDLANCAPQNLFADLN